MPKRQWLSCTKYPWLALAAAAFFLSACALGGPPPRDNAGDTARFTRPDYGVSVRYLATLSASHDFEADYFLGTRWNPDAPENMPGEALLSLTLPESNRVTRGVLRLGASGDAAAVRHCTDVDSTSRRVTASPQTAEIGGLMFTRIDSGDAAMSHYMQRRSYRSVHRDRCIAIDLIVTGTRGEVYDPPRKAPFDRDEAFARLTHLLGGVTFGP